MRALNLLLMTCELSINQHFGLELKAPDRCLGAFRLPQCTKLICLTFCMSVKSQCKLTIGIIKVNIFDEIIISDMKRLLVILILLVSFSCKSADNVQPDQPNSFEPKSSGEIVKHTYYTLAYSEENEQAFWVYYVLTPELINGPQSRTDDFRADPAVSTGSATLDDYKGSGYDRGHLCPAADMALNKTSMSETFYLSNMSPQVPSFNRGIWSTMEDQVRKWALKYSKLYVVTGPIFKDGQGTIGEDKVTVPGYYYKVLFDGKDKMIGFILPNAKGTNTIESYAVSVDSIESLTGVDFFPELDDQIENQLESETNTLDWSL